MSKEDCLRYICAERGIECHLDKPEYRINPSTMKLDGKDRRLYDKLEEMRIKKEHSL